MLPGSATDLPPYLVKPQDVYLLVTAGASYTAIQVLANPEVMPLSVARALSSALAGTPLRGRTVEWSADRYSAAQVSEDHHHFGAMRGSNVVSIAPLMVGLRRVGLTPHLLLRVPRYAQVSLPQPSYSTNAFRWYDARRLAGQPSIAVTAMLSPLSLALPLSFLLAVPVIGLLGLWLAGFLSSREQRDDTARRQIFRKVNSYAMMAAVLALFGSIFPLFHALVLPTLADLWFGSSSITTFVPYVIIAATPLMLFLMLAHKQETRRFGPLSTAPAIPMSDEEKAVRKRVAQYSRVPHIIGALILAVALFAVPRRSPLYSFVHPVAVMLPALAGLLTSKLFSKSLGKFTRKTIEQDLTWRARQLGQTLGVRMPDVFVEDSSRAAHLAFASHQRHHITLSRKLQETFTPAETDFVLAHHLACMKRKPTFGRAGLTLFLLFLPIVALPVLLLWSIMPGASGAVALLRSSWLVPAAISYLLVSVALMPLVGKSSARRQVGNDTEADRNALEATGNLAAAESALDKMVAGDIPMLTHIGKIPASDPARMQEETRAGGILLRRLELQKTAQMLGLAPTPSAKMTLPDLSPFSSSDADRR